MTERAAQGYHFREGRGGRALADLIDTFLLFKNQLVIILVTEVEQNLSDLLFHSLKIIPCSKRWKGPLTGVELLFLPESLLYDV